MMFALNSRLLVSSRNCAARNMALTCSLGTGAIKCELSATSTAGADAGRPLKIGFQHQHTPSPTARIE